MSATNGAGISIEARGLTRRFGARVALDALDLSIPANASFGLLGANGAGKTTFIRLISGFLLPTAGTLSVGGISPAKDPASVRRRLGLVTETSRLYPELRVEGFLRFAAGARGLSGDARDAAVARVSKRFGLDQARGRQIGNLSKGYEQRVSLAQAFLCNPPLLLVDEPTVGLDPVQRAEVQDVLRELQGECTVLLCTHDLDEARRLSSRAAVLNEGRLVAEGPTRELLDGRDPLPLFRAREG